MAYDPQKDQDLFGGIFGSGAETPDQPTAGAAAAEGEIQKAANEMDSPAGATPEESQADAISTPSASDQLEAVAESDEEPGETQADSEISDDELSSIIDSNGEDTEEKPLTEEEIMEILGEGEEPVKPFGNERITEDEAVEMDK